MKKLGKMGKFGFLIVFILSLSFNAYWLLKGEKQKPGQEEKLEKVVVVRVIDGDTFDIEKGQRVRLAGADSPEYPKGCLSEAAKQRLTELIAGKEVALDVLEKDSFGRFVAFVFVDDLFVDEALVEEGLAKTPAINHPKFGSRLAESEDQAKKAQRGIWSSLCAHPLGSSCLIKGNVRRDLKTKVYHLPDCFNYEKIVVNEQQGDQWFCDEEKAAASGFRKSEDCPQE